MSFLKNRIYSFKNAFRGVFVFFKTYGGAHAKIHLVAAFVVLCMGFYFSLSILEWTLLVIAIGLVLVSEIINSAIEQLVDLVHPEWNEKAGVIKDMTAGAVLISALIAVFIGIAVFWKYLYQLFPTT